MAIETLYKVEPPLQEVDDGFGYWGAVNWDSDTDKIECHICGKWFAHLSFHLRGHNITPREYRKQFGLSLTTPLCNRAYSAAKSKSALDRIADSDNTFGTFPKGAMKTNLKLRKSRRWKNAHQYSLTSAMYKNKRGTCPEQLRRRFVVACDVLGTDDPTIRGLLLADNVLANYITNHFRSINKFKTHINAKIVRRKNIWTEERVISSIRKVFKEKKRLPKSRDFREDKQKGMPNIATVYDVFGSWNRALVIALGLDERKVS